MFAAILLSACATTTPPQGGPRGLRASDHLEAARAHSEAAANRAQWPEPTPVSNEAAIVARGAAGPPWFYYWQADADERLAQEHRSAAASLQAEYEAACGDTPAAEVTVSPVVRYAIGGTTVADGAVVYLSTDAGTPEHVLAAIRCHRAWMMLGRTAMDDCPLDLPRIELVAHAQPGAIELSITTRDASQVPELQRRVAHDVEAGASRSLHAAPR